MILSPFIEDETGKRYTGIVSVDRLWRVCKDD